MKNKTLRNLLYQHLYLIPTLIYADNIRLIAVQVQLKYFVILEAFTIQNNVILNFEYFECNIKS